MPPAFGASFRTRRTHVSGMAGCDDPDREMISRQEHPPGRRDVTELADLGITIAG